MGRPTKLTPNIQKMIIEGIRLGLTYSKTAELAGITRHTLRNWIKKGAKAKSGKYFKFFTALKAAEAEGEVRNLQKIQEAATGGQETVNSREYYKDNKLVQEITKTKTMAPDWRAAAWLLERRYPERYGKLLIRDSAYHPAYGDYEIYIIAKALSKMTKSELEQLKLIIQEKKN